MIEDHASTTVLVPKWVKRVKPIAVWSGVTILFAAASALFWRTVSLSTDAALMHQDMDYLQKANEENGRMRSDVALIKWQTAQLMYAHDSAVWVLQADWNRRHGLPQPPQPQPPPPKPTP